MNADTLLSFIQHFGYAALFFALWLGIVGMPVPDEVVVMTGGAVTANGFLHVLPAFALTYLGVVSGLSLGYALGRFFGNAVLDRLRRKKNMQKYIDVSDRLVRKYGRFALCISYFFPVVRHVMPYVVGLHHMKFRQYALFSFTTGLVWTAIFFTIGRLVGDHAQTIGELAYRYGLRLVWIPFAAGAAVLAIRYMFKQHKSKGERSS
ncbi:MULTISPECIES: DedA family protein [Paenibacillus]|uniref:Alkaline phosphatase n=1 Tax=Paenibacillus albilobatus TaxID=2716884 RepID=A0A919XCK1_9BACL|nr:MULTISPECIES: DedA family protein [Paenibacillus]GIO29671.1 alkaline phosphatase [Paenibacillus albilobatus]